jgi:hypothetical protein
MSGDRRQPPKTTIATVATAVVALTTAVTTYLEGQQAKTRIKQESAVQEVWLKTALEECKRAAETNRNTNHEQDIKISKLEWSLEVLLKHTEDSAPTSERVRLTIPEQPPHEPPPEPMAKKAFAKPEYDDPRVQEAIELKDW